MSILARTPWIPSWHDVGMCTDRRHILWLYEILRSTGVHRTLEIGVYSGASSSAFIAAKVPTPEFCDISHSEQARSIIGTHKFHQRPGLEVIQTEPPYDIVFIDATHTTSATEPEIRALLDNPPKIIAAHDVTSSIAGFEHCDGGQYVWHRLQADGWHCLVDAKVRRGERTDRGLLVATKDEFLYNIIRLAYLTIAVCEYSE